MPVGKHALIHVKQPRGQLVAVRARPATQAEPPPRELRLWQDCDVVQVGKNLTAKIGLAVINSRYGERRRKRGIASGVNVTRFAECGTALLHNDLGRFSPEISFKLKRRVRLAAAGENAAAAAHRKTISVCHVRKC